MNSGWKAHSYNEFMVTRTRRSDQGWTKMEHSRRPLDARLVHHARGLLPARAGLPHRTECPLARNSDRAGRSTHALKSIAHRSHIPKPTQNPNRKGHAARSHDGKHGHWRGTGMTARAREKLGKERKACSAARACSGIQASMVARENQTTHLLFRGD